MKKILYSVMVLAIAAMTFTACEDVPEPYPTPTGGGTSSGIAALPYQSANLNTGWVLYEVTEGAQPWSKGSSYAQATGYQTWDGGSQKSNKAVEGWLISPPISTLDHENVKLSFNYTIRYANNYAGWEDNHKIFVSADFDGADASEATWKEVPFTPKASPYTDWTLYSSGEIQLPVEYANKETICIGFWFKAPETGSTTWELQSFKMEDGYASEPEEPTPDTPKAEPKGDGSLENPFNAAAATATALKLASGEISSDSYYIKGKVAEIKYNYGEGKYPKSADFYISEDGTTNNTFYVYGSKYLGNTDYTSGTVLAVGDEVIIYGQLQNYNGTAETATNKSFLYSLNGEGGGVTPDPTPTPQPSGKGTASDPYTVAEAIAAGSGTGVYVKAFIVGSVSGQVLTEGAVFSDNGDAKTNLLIAAIADETDISKCMPVQLPNGDVRTALNLVDNKGNYKKEVTLYGNIEKYFGATGIKSVTFAILDGQEIGKNPDEESGGDDTQDNEIKTVTVAEFNAAAESTSVWYQLTGTISNLKDNDQYGNFDLTDDTGSVYVYGVLSEKGGAKKQFQQLAKEKDIKNGSKITIIGNRGSYSGKIEVTNAYFVSVSN